MIPCRLRARPCRHGRVDFGAMSLSSPGHASMYGVQLYKYLETPYGGQLLPRYRDRPTYEARLPPGRT